jgi:nucleotide-binding universal stress UspA family protein
VFKKILLPLDGSANAEGAIPWAIQYAAASRTPVVLTRVLEKVYPLKGMPFGAEAGEARTYLEAVARTFSGVGIPTELVLPVDPVAEAIVSAAKRAGCNLIVMASRGTSRLVRRLVGGVTEQVIRRSPVPVLVARSQQVPGRIGAPSRILVPVDGSAASKHVLAWAERLARFHQVPTEILFVRPRQRRHRASEDRRTEEVSSAASRLCSLLRSRGLAASFHLGEGAPADEILRACRSTDLIVMTTHGYGGLKHLLKGSVAERVIHGALGPVFVSKHGPRAGTPRRGATPKTTMAVGLARGASSRPSKNGRKDEA